MAHRRRKRNTEYGLVGRVAKATGKSLSLVSMVKNGQRSNEIIEKALAVERAKMREERGGAA
jgi:hypothetical protein